MTAVSLHAGRGSAFTRYCMEIADGGMHAKAAVAAGTLESATWAGPLGAVPGAAEFVGLLKQQTVIGRLNVRRVPFQTRVVSRTGGGIFGWGGQGAPKVVSSLAYDSTSLPVRSASGIIVLDEELVRHADPRAENDVRSELVEGFTNFLDQQFIDPAVSEDAGTSPASITNGVTPIASTGSPAEDIRALTAAVVAAIDTMEGVSFLMSEVTALGIATTLVGAFPQGVAGGLFGIVPVLLSASTGDTIVAVHGPSVLVAEGRIDVQPSSAAALQMKTDPQTGAQNLVSLWQTNSKALRVERETNWLVAREGAVQYVADVNYGAAES